MSTPTLLEAAKAEVLRKCDLCADGMPIVRGANGKEYHQRDVNTLHHCLADELRAAIAAEEAAPPSLEKELADALRDLAECSKCQNGCAPDDMTCASNKARAVLARYDAQQKTT